MRAGGLRHRLTVDRPVVTQGPTGEEVLTWQDCGQVWASIEPIRGRESLQAGQVLADMDTRIKIRWSASVDEINAKWRVRKGSVIYNIKQIAHIALRQREIEIMAHSGTNLG